MNRENRSATTSWLLAFCCVAVALAGSACTRQESETAVGTEEGSQVASNEPAPETSQAPEPEPAAAPPPAPRSQPAYQAPSAPPAPTTVTVTVPESTPLKIKFTEELNSGVNQAGQTFRATLVESIIVGDRVALPEGSTVEGTITDVVPAKKGLKESGGALTLSFDRITTPSGTSAAMAASFSQQAKSTAKKSGTIGGAAAGGAILGKVLGGDTKDAAIGAVVGGAIGTGVAAGTKGTEMKIKAGAEMTITLEQALSLKMKR